MVIHTIHTYIVLLLFSSLYYTSKTLNKGHCEQYKSKHFIPCREVVLEVSLYCFHILRDPNIYLHLSHLLLSLVEGFIHFHLKTGFSVKNSIFHFWDITIIINECRTHLREIVMQFGSYVVLAL